MITIKTKRYNPKADLEFEIVVELLSTDEAGHAAKVVAAFEQELIKALSEKTADPKSAGEA